MIRAMMDDDPPVRDAALQFARGLSSHVGSGVFADALAEVAKPARIRILGRFADDFALAAVRSALTDGDPAVREAAVESLGAWPTPEPIADLLIAARAEDESRRTPLIKGLIRLCGLPADRTPVETAALVGDLLALTRDPEDRNALRDICRKAIRPRNLARGAKASSPDGLEPDGSSGPDQVAIDGNPDTFWDETDNQKLYRFVVTFPQPTDVSAVCIQGHAYRSHSPKDFDILCDDKVVKTIRNAEYAKDANTYFVMFPRTKCAALELRITGYYGCSPGIRELEIYDMSEADASILAAPASPPAAFAWRQADGVFALCTGDRVVWQFNYGKDLSRPFFHPVTLVEGTELTWLAPPDHPHHRALWFAWNKLNDVDYWAEPTPEAPNGKTEITSFQAAPGKDFAARMEMELRYHPPGKPPVLTEKRVIAISAPDEAGGYSIDWESTFTPASGAVHLKGGTHGGGYAGLSVRVARDCRYPLLIDSEGRRDGDCGGMTKNTHGQRARWADLSFAPGVGQSAGIAIFDHPTNLRHPSQWHNIIDGKTPFVYFSPAPLWSEPYTLPADATLTLRYRILVHAGRLESNTLERLWQAWSGVSR